MSLSPQFLSHKIWFFSLVRQDMNDWMLKFPLIMGGQQKQKARTTLSSLLVYCRLSLFNSSPIHTIFATLAQLYSTPNFLYQKGHIRHIYGPIINHLYFSWCMWHDIILFLAVSAQRKYRKQFFCHKYF